MFVHWCTWDAWSCARSARAHCGNRKRLGMKYGHMCVPCVHQYVNWRADWRTGVERIAQVWRRAGGAVGEAAMHHASRGRPPEGDGGCWYRDRGRQLTREYEVVQVIQVTHVCACLRVYVERETQREIHVDPIWPVGRGLRSVGQIALRLSLHLLTGDSTVV